MPPASREALSAASGHSNQGKTCGVTSALHDAELAPVHVHEHGVLVHDRLGAFVVDVAVAEHGIDDERRAVGTGDDVDAAPAAHSVRGQLAGHLVPRPRIVGRRQRGSVGTGDHRGQTLGEALDDGAVGLPAGAQVGLLDEIEPFGLAALQGLGRRVGPGTPTRPSRAGVRSRR